MLHGHKIDFIEKYNSLISKAKSGNDTLTDDLCNFIVTEFELQASVFFKVAKDKKLSVLGKSVGARKNFLKGSQFECSYCKHNEKGFKSEVYTDTSCELQISEFLVYETCLIFSIENDEKFFIKIAKKTPFSPADNDSLNKLIEFIKSITEVWYLSRGGKVKVSKNSFPEIVDNCSQKIRTSANSIIGFSSILLEENLTSNQFEYISNTKKNAQSLIQSINDLIDLSRFEEDKVKINNNSTNIKDMLEQLLSSYDDIKKKLNCTIDSKIDSLIPSEIEIDNQKLKFILNNLILLSVSLTENGKVDFKANITPKNSIEFTIQNNGFGLSNESIKILFDPFSTTEIKTLKDSSISSLGLTITKKYIDILSGSFSIKKNPQAGITINLTIPTSAMVPGNIFTSLNNYAEGDDNKKVLVIEDDYATSKLLSNYLNKWGYDPAIVNTEEQTLELIAKEKFLAVIMDIELPTTNGLELLQKIKNHDNTKHTPVIVCSVESEQQKAFMMGAVEYFVKPINYNFLVEVLTNYKLRKDSTVLCVDDDPPTLNLVTQAIESAGLKPLPFNVSADVIENILDKEIDLAIVDLDMPDPNGFELIRLIKSHKQFAKLPIIIYTGKENYQEDIKNIDGLFEDLLQKQSTNLEDLAGTINSMIQRYETPETVEEIIEKDDVIKILLAEDYKHSQIIVTRLLKKNGFENVVVVENGEEAVKMAKQEIFNLILMDMQMPIMNGFEATENLRQLPEYKNTPIIALTAFAMKGDREKCLEAGATDYIPKPIDSKEFINKVKYYTVEK